MLYLFSDHIDHKSVSFIFELIEKPPSPEFEDTAVDQLVNVLLALNLHYTEYETNPIMSVLAEKGTVKTFTEKLLILFNRGGKFYKDISEISWFSVS